MNVDWSLILQIVVPVAATVFGAMFQDWSKRRNRVERLRGAVVDATSYVQFVDQWYQAQTRVGGESMKREAGEWTANELERTRVDLADRLATEPLVRHDELNPIRTALLFYKMQAILAKISRGVFLVTLGIDVTAVLGTFAEPRPNIVGMIGGSILLVAVALGFRSLAVHWEQKNQSGSMTGTVVRSAAAPLDSDLG